MSQPRRLDLSELTVTSFEPGEALPISANIQANTDASACDCGLWTLNGANTCGYTYCNPGTCWIECF
jgi:hypothetical protein